MIEADKALSVRFFLHPKENPAKSKAAGRPIFDEIEMVSIMAPGNTKTEHTARAHGMHYVPEAGRQMTYAERFQPHYDAFKAGLDDHVSGTPLSEAPFLSLGQKAEMRAKKILTIEQLAGMADRDIRSAGMGFREYVDSAKAYLDTATGTSSLASEMAELRRQLAELQGNSKPEPAPAQSAFAAMDAEDLRNMLSDAGVEVDGRWKRDTLVKKAEELATKASEAA